MEQSVKNEYDELRVRDLLADYTSAELAEKLIALQDEFDDLETEHDDTIAELTSYQEASDNFGALSSLAEAVTTSYFSAEVVYVNCRTFGHQVLLDVDMTPGEALAVRAGHRVTLALADPADFAALYQEV